MHACEHVISRAESVIPIGHRPRPPWGFKRGGKITCIFRGLLQVRWCRLLPIKSDLIPAIHYILPRAWDSLHGNGLVKGSPHKACQ